MTLEKFKLLCWKNFTLQKRHPIAGLFEILFPIAIVVIFTIARSHTRTTEVPEIKFHEFQPYDYRYCETLNGQSIAKIGVSPSSNPAIRELVELSVGRKSGIVIEFYENASELNSFLRSENNTVGIEFKDELSVS